MPREKQQTIYLGIRECVLALDAASGSELWRVELIKKDYTQVLWDGVSLLAANGGELFCLDPRTGAILWHNEMKGLGRGLISLASTRVPTGSTDSNAAMKRAQEAAQAAAAAGAAG